MHMTSYPSIQSSLSETQNDFVSFVEDRIAEWDGPYQADHDTGLPGATVRLSVTADDSNPDVAERRHTVEFMSLTEDGCWEAVGSIRQSLKEIEALQGRYTEI